MTADLGRLTRLRSAALIAGVAGLAAAWALAFLTETATHFYLAWLVAFCFTAGLPLGSLVILMLQYLTGGDWGFVLRRPLEAATRTMPLVTLFYLPLIVGFPFLYEWAHHEEFAHSSPNPGAFKAAYLEPTFVLARAAGCFAIWNLLVWLFNLWSRQMDQRKDQAIVGRCEALSAPGMILYVLTISVASIDWVMSLEPHWYSTIYPAMFGMGQVLAAMAFAVLVLCLLANVPAVEKVVAGQPLRDLGSLMLAFVMVWAYLSLMQFLLIWSANLPEEVPWYIPRMKGGWQVAGLALILLHFALPFVLLLSTDIKRNPGRLVAVAGLLVGMRLVDLTWLIVPAVHGLMHTPVVTPLIYLGTIVGLGGLWLAFYLWQLGRMPLVPEFKPYAEAAAHGEVAH